MKKKFADIFESINVLHKKYSEQSYLQNLENFNNSSKELEEILEKYNTQSKSCVNKKKIRA